MQRASRQWPELDLLGEVLKVLHDQERAKREEVGGDLVSALRAQVLPKYPQLEDRVLDSALPSGKNPRGSFQKTGRYLYLEPLQRGGRALPLLDVEHDFRGSPPKLGLRLMLFLLSGGKLRSIGFRFESPGNSGTTHGYWHVQLLSTLESPRRRRRPGPEHPEGALDLGALAWLPETQPALPLPTSSPVGLLLCLVISLYGPEIYGRLRQGVRFDLRPKLQKGYAELGIGPLHSA